MDEVIGMVEGTSHAIEKLIGRSPALAFLLLSAALFLTAALLTRTRRQQAQQEPKPLAGQRAEDGRI